MRGPPAQQLTALTANVFNPPRGDQGCAEEEAESSWLPDLKHPLRDANLHCPQGLQATGHWAGPLQHLSPSMCVLEAKRASFPFLFF